MASLVAKLGGLGPKGSAVVAHGLSCSAACGVFLDQGSNLVILNRRTTREPQKYSLLTPESAGESQRIVSQQMGANDICF